MLSELQQQGYTVERRSGKERRTSARYPFTATFEGTEPRSGARVMGRASDLGRGGCYVDTIGPFPEGSVLMIRIIRDDEALTIEAKVVFSQRGMGMGLAFLKAMPDQQALLDRWIAELSGETVSKPAVAPKPDRRATPAAGVAAKGGATSSFFVMNELIVLLLQKGVLSESEGKSLLQKLLK